MIGKRVRVLPHTDHWMRGIRYGVVVQEKAHRVVVKHDLTGVCVTLWRTEIEEV